MIRVLIVSQGVALRAGLRALLGEASDLTIAGEAASLIEIGQLPPETDVLLVTAEAALRAEIVRLLRPRRDSTLGAQAVSGAALLLLADEVEAGQRLRGLPVRAWGVLPPSASAEELVAAIRALDTGLVVGRAEYLDPLFVRPALTGAGDDLAYVETLTAREAEVLQLLAQGLANKEIARELEISEHTVKFHLSSIYSKLGATNRAEAVTMGVRQGLIPL